MLLAIDVGNTNTVMGLYAEDPPNPGPQSGAGPKPVDELVDCWRASTVAERTSDEWQLLVDSFLAQRNIHLQDIDAMVVASVVPKVTAALVRMCDRVGRAKPMIVSPDTDTGMPVLLDDPLEVGADRIANAVAAFALVGGPTIVVDLGTATTFDIISAAGEYLGGVILPGIEISLDALFDRAAALRRIELSAPTHVIGRSTAGAVRSGATHGYAAQVDGLCERFEAELGSCHVIATGGLSAMISPLSHRIERHEPWLTLEGLRLIYQRADNL